VRRPEERRVPAHSPVADGLVDCGAASAAVLSHYVIDVVARLIWLPHGRRSRRRQPRIARSDRRNPQSAAALRSTAGFRLCCEAATRRGARATSAAEKLVGGGAVLRSATVVFRLRRRSADGGRPTRAGAVRRSTASTMRTAVRCCSASRPPPSAGSSSGTALFAVARWLLSRRDRTLPRESRRRIREPISCGNPQQLNRLGSRCRLASRVSSVSAGVNAHLPHDARESTSHSTTASFRRKIYHTLIGAACCLIMGTSHTPSGAPITQAQIVIDRAQAPIATTDAKGDLSVERAARQYVVSASARGVRLRIGQHRDRCRSHLDVVLDRPIRRKLRTIGRSASTAATHSDRNVDP